MNEGPDDHSAGPDPARAAQLLAQMRELPANAAETRINAVGRKCEEILRGQIAAIRDQSPAWSVDLMADWWDDQVVAISATLGDVKATLPDELRKQFGDSLIADVSDAVQVRIAGRIAAVRNRCESILATELPDAAAHRAQRPVQEAREATEERLTELETAVSSAAASARRAWLVAVVAITLALIAWYSR